MENITEIQGDKEMGKLGTEILYRIQVRKLPVGSVWDSDKKQNGLTNMLIENIIEADNCALQTGYWDIYPSTKCYGKLVVFYKKVIRKLIKIFLGWYIFPIYQKQSLYNGKVVNALNIQKDIIIRQIQEIKEMEEKLLKLTEQLNVLQNEKKEIDLQ